MDQNSGVRTFGQMSNIVTTKNLLLIKNIIANFKYNNRELAKK